MNSERKLFNKFLILLFILIFSSSIYAQNAKNLAGEQIIDVNFCELLKNSDEYKDKIVRVKATYRYGFEWSELYCSDCLNKGQVWLDVTDSFSENSKKKYIKKLKSNGFAGRTVNVILVGKLYSGSRYGHMSGYVYKFVAEKIENAEVIYKYSPVSQYLPEEIKAKTYCQNKD